ncbi:MAG: ATP-dependent DNA ligase [Nostocoides sp.]
MADDAAHVEIASPDGVRTIRISSPDRVLWPETPASPAITKADLAAYVMAVGEPLVAHLADRPVTLQRFPEGVEREAFYSKNPPKGVPEWASTVAVRYPSGRRHPQLVVNEAATAVWAVQMNTITFHPWPVRTNELDNPDEMRIDLDPQPGRTFADAATVALALRELMLELGLTPYAKTSGNRGVHVFAPIAATHEFLDVRHAVIGIARELERRMPELVTTSWWKEERGVKVFVDFNQACRDRTIAAAYSPRPLPGAPVSTPVTWAELTVAGPSRYTVLTVPDLLGDRGDPWADMADHTGSLTAALELWQADLDAGLGELNFPPDYPKMPGEPPRVPPSKRRADKADADYLTPKADRDAEQRRLWDLPVLPPVEPMLAKPAKAIPAGEVLIEPKWDGFRALVFRSGDRLEMASRNGKPMTRYFPELVAAFTGYLPDKVVLDGEVILIRPDEPRLDFELLQERLHPAASRVAKLANETPASFVAFDLLALGDVDYSQRPLTERRAALEEALAGVPAPIYLTPATTDRDLAARWFTRFEGAGLDGLIVKASGGLYTPGKRSMTKIKHERTADVVVAGYRTYAATDDAVGSLLLGLFAHDGALHSIGVVGAFPMARRKELFAELQPLVTTFSDHPWSWAEQEMSARTPTSGGGSRWNAGKDLSFTPLQPVLVAEVRYDHMEGTRFRHTAQFVRWRPDRDPQSCTYAQLDEPVSYDLGDVLAGGSR